MESAVARAVVANCKRIVRTLKPARVPRRLRDEKGVAFAFVGVAFIVLIGLTAVGVDTGRVAATATEAQNTADIAALAGMKSVYIGGTAQDGAAAALDHNLVNGQNANTALTIIETGYTDETYTYTAGGTPTNSVRAVASVTVDNIALAAIGAPQSTVSREAIATLSGLGSGIPTLPVVIGDCHYDPYCEDQNCMPVINQVPDSADNTGWTGFFDSTSTSDVIQYAPATAGCGGGGLQQFIRVGDYINVANGQNVPVLQEIVCYVLATGEEIFTIPIIECGHAYLQPQLVVGFAKIRITNAKSTGAEKGFDLTGIWEAPRPGPPGGGNFGLSVISLIK